jgi:serine/threonine protein kinase
MARRFRSEIKLARRVRHPNVCGIHEYGEDGDLRYISMELIQGTDLKQIVQGSGALPREEAYEVAIQLAEGLGAIHDVGIIHRDLKTANVMRDGRGLVRLMDFGIAKQLGVEASASATATGHILGTPEYMSPEQARSQPLDSRTDIYALGIVIFEIFTGRVPFHGDTPVATLLKHLQELPPLYARESTGIPAPLVRVLRTALAKDPADRYATVRELTEDLRRARAESAVGPGATASNPVLVPTVVPAEALHDTLLVPPEAATRTSVGIGDTAASKLSMTLLSPRPHVGGKWTSGQPDTVGAAAAAARPLPGPAPMPTRRWPGVVAALLAAGGAFAAIRLLPFIASSSKPALATMPVRATPSSGSPDTPSVARPAPTSMPIQIEAASEHGAEPRVRSTTDASSSSARETPTRTVPSSNEPVGHRKPGTKAVPEVVPTPTPAATTAPLPSPLPPLAATGVLQLVVRPWAEVTVDGVSVGTTPFRPLTLGAGIHTVVFSHPNYKSFQRKVTVRAKETTRLEVDLTWEAFRR